MVADFRMGLPPRERDLTEPPSRRRAGWEVFANGVLMHLLPDCPNVLPWLAGGGEARPSSRLGRR